MRCLRRQYARTANDLAGSRAAVIVCSDRARYDTCQSRPMPADQLEAPCTTGWRSAIPTIASRALLQRGLRQRRSTVREWYERHTVKELEARLERTLKAWTVYGATSEIEFRREREII